MNESRYLQNDLGVAVQTIYDMRASCEVDTTRIDPSDIARELPANTKRLQSQAGVHLEPSLPLSPRLHSHSLHHKCNPNLTITAAVWASVLHSIDHVPAQLRCLFYHLREVFPAR